MPAYGFDMTYLDSCGISCMLTAFEDDVEHGTQTVWYEGTGKKSEMQLEHGVPVGVLTFWHESGDKAGEIRIADGVKHGLERRWGDSGQVVREQMWVYGEVQDSE